MKQEIDLYSLPVHPWAARFPMRSDDDLKSMAQSIKAHGLRVPIAIGEAKLAAEDSKPTLCLIDGRNRLAACQMAGITPTYSMLNGEDMDAYIADANLERRDLTKGQKAMLLAVRYPETQQGKKRTSEDSSEVSQRRINQARMVLKYCPDMVEAVIEGGSGKNGLDEAYAEAQRRRQVEQATETRFAQLEKTDPDLAIHVREEHMRLTEAEAVVRERREDEKRERDAATRMLQNIDDSMSGLNGELLAKRALIFQEHPDNIPFDDLPAIVEGWIDTLSRFLEAIEPEVIDHEQDQDEQ